MGLGQPASDAADVAGGLDRVAHEGRESHSLEWGEAVRQKKLLLEIGHLLQSNGIGWRAETEIEQVLTTLSTYFLCIRQHLDQKGVPAWTYVSQNSR